MHRYSVIEERCVRCGACSSVAPSIFEMGERGARALRAPGAADEERLAEAARINCPGQAISRTRVEGEEASPVGGVAAEREEASLVGGVAAEGEGLFGRLFEEAEKVRWRMSDVPWGDIERGWVTPAFLRFVREVALSELTTFSATRRFLSDMGGDPDFSSWVAVWFYEETKHPDALFRWLAAFDVKIPPRDVLRGRVTSPFMRSRTGTLVMNVLSELFASTGYRDLARYTKEPVLAGIFRNLAGDEARHGASFYGYARRAIDASQTPEIERREALKVLYYWVQAADHVEHPVNQFHEKVSADPELLAVLREVGTDYGPVLSQACKLVGTLVDLPLRAPEDVLPALRAQGAGTGAESAGR
ncbi:MAG: ferredoxin [Polyangiaceae bacterium]